MANFTQEIDARNELCPIPVMRTKKALKNMKAGEILHVVATDPASVQDITILMEALKDKLIDSTKIDGVFHFYIKKV